MDTKEHRISKSHSSMPITYHRNAPYGYGLPARTAHELQQSISKTMAVISPGMRDGG
jgi:hypothetical protein